MNVDDIFVTALTFAESAERNTYLDRVCAGDAPLRQEVDSLLAAHNRIGAFLQQRLPVPFGVPPAGVAAPEPAEAGTPNIAPFEQPGLPRRSDAEAGDRIGRYKLLEQIGEGGMGVVWMAEQEEPVRRRVALKIIKLGMDTREVIARFEAERQALALMDHPNIARVFDGGATGAESRAGVSPAPAAPAANEAVPPPNADAPAAPGRRDACPTLAAGRPFFVMELVRGLPITKYCDELKLSTRDRLELFGQVCRAVQHAHQKGVIHRDLKPSNILVTEQDGRPVPKVIDFGIAKATAGRLTDKTLFTGFQQWIGTPSYMSPEQAGLGSLDIDTRSDTYSLGVVLYQLLTGHTPFDTQELLKSGFEAVLRTIREVDPPKPSTRLKQGLLVQQDASAGIPHSAFRTPHSAFDPDLDWIVMKCLEKDRNRRYETPNALAADLERYLHDEPIVARPPSTGYRLGKFVRKHRGPVVATVGFVVLLVGALAVSLGLATWANSERARAEHAKKSESAQRHRAEGMVIRLELDRAEDFLAAGDVSSGLAYLARVLREHPTNRVAGERLLSALSFRAFPMPLGEPLLHQDITYHAAFSPDGHRVVTASGDGTARVWDAHTGRPVTPPLPHQEAVRYACFSPDGTLVATASHDRSARLWDARTGQPVTAPLRHDSDVDCVQFSPDGTKVVTGSADWTARIWEARTGKPLASPLRHLHHVQCVEFSPDGRWVVTGSRDNSARVWDAATGQPVTELLRHADDINEAHFSSDGTQVLTACGDGRARVWDVGTSRLVHDKIRHPGQVLFARFSPEGQRILTGSADHTAGQWNVFNGEPATERLKHSGPVMSGEFSPDGNLVVTASIDQTARIWDARLGTLMGAPLKHADRIISARFSPDGRRVVTASWDKSAQVWDTALVGALPELIIHSGHVACAAFSPDGQRLITASDDGTARLWSADRGLLPGPRLRHDAWVLFAQFSLDGQHVLTVAEDQAARVWEAQTGQLLATVQCESSARNLYDRFGDKVMSVAHFSPEGRRVATGDTTGAARVWDALTGQPLTPPLRHTNADLRAICSVRFSPDGSRLVTASYDKTSAVWDAHTGQRTLEIRDHHDEVFFAEFSPDGSRLVTAGADKTVRLWDPRSGAAVAPPLQHEAAVLLALFSPAGGRLLSVAADNTARLWDSTTGEPLCDPLRHPGNVRFAAFSPDGDRWATACDDGAVRIWDAHTGRLLSEPLSFNAKSRVDRVQFSRDGQRLVAAAPLAIPCIWEVPRVPVRVPGWLPELAEAIGGQRLNDQHILEVVSRQALAAAMARLEQREASDVYTGWFRWFVERVPDRTVSPFSKMTFGDYVQRLVAQNTQASLMQAERLAPSNGLAYARLGRLLLHPEAPRTSSRVGLALWHTRRGVELAPTQPDVWRAHLAVLEQAERWDEILQAVEPAIQTAPDDARFWATKAGALEKLDRLDEAMTASKRAVALAGAPTNLLESALNRALLVRSMAFRRLNRLEEATADNLAALGIPPRDPSASPRQIDLSLHYNASLTQSDWYRLTHVSPSNDLSELRGVQELAGVAFDLRGLVQVGLRNPAGRDPSAVRGIAVHQRCRRMQFLHAAVFGSLTGDGLEVGRYVVHFTDGERIEIPLRNGRELADWWAPADEGTKPFVIAWEGQNGGGRRHGFSIRLFKLAWENPVPEKQVATVDFLCDRRTEAAPFLVALTLEP